MPQALVTKTAGSAANIQNRGYVLLLIVSYLCRAVIFLEMTDIVELIFLLLNMKNQRKIPAYWKSLSDTDKKEFWSSIDFVISDCDGVLWLSGSLIPGSEKVFNALKAKGKATFLFTNNSAISPGTIAEKSRILGFDVTAEDLLMPLSLTVHYLKSLNFKKKIYLVGSEGFAKELTDAGYECIGVGPDCFVPPPGGEDFDDSKFNFTLDPDVGAVVVGHDFHFSYVKLFKACQYLADPECLFIGAAPDVRYPMSLSASKMSFAPATGCLVNAIASVSNREPVIMGKPERMAAQLLLKSKGLRPERSLMIGDNLNTDIKFGNITGMKTLLVLSGMTKSVDEKSWENEDLVPTFCTESLADLLDSL